MALDDLYRDVILDHYAHPRNRGRLDPRDITAEGANPLCGDELTLFVRLDGDRVAAIRFEGRGCSISQASASMMTEAVAGKTLEEVRALVDAFRAMMHGGAPAAALGDLVALQGVRKFPVRVKCATLPWVTLEQGLDDAAAGRPATTVTTDTRE
ncbi:MAG: SUF system NifU family Fe-S cluster assembly protein [Armatimonadota bacterium]|nr:SUF system NifU family Fe-S cluster assembly protein [Armatimonadota bacterium]MDR7422890.1 SUF system NifU family Fe-S cluster assembly protein [Armatimonadota bacterium]MDR7454371.1 SUF system NifU family Fe-S cluster assembly protein [Armatimonadota bacterium]MDR7455921.1 SUF system NifU family Fe-S cluster assembly protein [Armatimonadota bacterium]MDR7497896.1 SUF system NifU family Fe-S cluster assembly protein [Armatimonadota bacterium]